MLSQPTQNNVTFRLTAREFEVLQLPAKGFSDREVADQLVLGEVTIRTHINSLLVNRSQAMVALSKGISPRAEENE